MWEYTKATSYLSKYKKDGLSIEDLHLNGAFTLDDFVVLPGLIESEVHKTNLETRITRNMTLNTPFISSSKETDADMAIAMAVCIPSTLNMTCIKIIHS
jgi:IMP dehydrogenase